MSLVGDFLYSKEVPAQLLLGYEDDELIGSSCFDLVQPDELDRVREVMEFVLLFVPSNFLSDIIL